MTRPRFRLEVTAPGPAPRDGALPVTERMDNNDDDDDDDDDDRTQLLLLGKVEYGGGPIFKVVLEC